jgi:hypothetical protein
MTFKPSISVYNRHPNEIIEDAMQEFAYPYVEQFPVLGHAHNEAVLDFLVGEKFAQLTSAIRDHMDEYLAVLRLRNWPRDRAFLRSLGGDLPPLPDHDGSDAPDLPWEPSAPVTSRPATG